MNDRSQIVTSAPCRRRRDQPLRGSIADFGRRPSRHVSRARRSSVRSAGGTRSTGSPRSLWIGIRRGLDDVIKDGEPTVSTWADGRRWRWSGVSSEPSPRPWPPQGSRLVAPRSARGRICSVTRPSFRRSAVGLSATASLRRSRTGRPLGLVAAASIGGLSAISVATGRVRTPSCAGSARSQRRSVPPGSNRAPVVGTRQPGRG